VLLKALCLLVPLQESKDGAACQEGSFWKDLMMLAWPGILNMLSIIVQGMGLQYISASVSQMISGAALQAADVPKPASPVQTEQLH
jgi:hypothetical protein